MRAVVILYVGLGGSLRALAISNCFRLLWFLFLETGVIPVPACSAPFLSLVHFSSRPDGPVFGIYLCLLHPNTYDLWRAWFFVLDSTLSFSVGWLSVDLTSSPVGRGPPVAVFWDGGHCLT